MSKAACVVALMFAACAMGGAVQTDGGASDAPVHRDASHVTSDAPITPPHDAAVTPHDAFVPQDAPDQGGFCNDNTNCGTGTCCWVALCIPGTPVGTNLCFPQ